LSHWGWENCAPWDDRQVVEFVEDKLYAVPVYAKDILDSPDVRYVELPNDLLVISWDNFRNDATVIRDESTEELVGWLLVEQVTEREFRIAYGCNNAFESLEEIKDFLREELEDTL
jgi:hypothetical protein